MVCIKFFAAFAACLLAVASGNLLQNVATEIGGDMQTFDENAPQLFRAYESRANEVKDIHLRFYNGRSLDKYVDIKLAEAQSIVSNSNFDKNAKTVFYIHGYKETPDNESVHKVVSAYFEAEPQTNVILIDWSNMAFGTYTVNAAPNTKEVAHAVAEQIKKLIDAGLALPKIHVVGHSLGGQTAGFIGKEMKELGITLPWISALDPAFPMFYPGWVLGQISKDDAEYVDIIHTSPGQYGAPVNTGRADFWPNKGSKPQPGCPTGLHVVMTPEDLCSHWRSWEFWAESVKNPIAFPCTMNGKTVYMGVKARESGANGECELSTNSAYPFGKGGKN